MNIIVARFEEDVSWTANLPNFTIIQKGVDLPNEGRETASHLHYILKNYDTLEGEYLFCQGNPFDHAPSFLQGIETERKYFGPVWECDGAGIGKGFNFPPTHALPVRKSAMDLELGEHDLFRFVGGAQFKVSAEAIKSRSKEYYTNLCSFAINVYEGPYIVERLWMLIWPELQFQSCNL